MCRTYFQFQTFEIVLHTKWMKNSKLFSLKIFDCHSRNDLVKEFLNCKIQNFFHETNFFWIINLDTKLVFIIQYCKHYSWIVPFCYILWREKLKKEILKKFPIVKKVITTPPKTFSPLLLHNFSYILPTWLPDTPIEFPPWRNISKKNFFCKKFERIFCFKATCDCEACCYDKFLKIKKITLDFC